MSLVARFGARSAVRTPVRPAFALARPSTMAARPAISQPARPMSDFPALDKIIKDCTANRELMREADDAIAQISDAETKQAASNSWLLARWRNVFGEPESMSADVADDTIHRAMWLREKYTMRMNYIRNAPQEVAAIDWSSWESKIKTPGLVAQLRKQYESEEAPQPIVAESKELEAEMKQTFDQHMSDLEGFSAKIDEELKMIDNEYKEVLAERNNLDNLTHEELLMKHPLVAEMIEKELEDDHWGPDIKASPTELAEAIKKEKEYKFQGRFHELFPEHWQREEGYIK